MQDQAEDRYVASTVLQSSRVHAAGLPIHFQANLLIHLKERRDTIKLQTNLNPRAPINQPNYSRVRSLRLSRQSMAGISSSHATLCTGSTTAIRDLEHGMKNEDEKKRGFARMADHRSHY